MMIYPREDERAIRVQRMVEDWAQSGLLQPEQRERMMADLAVDYRRTNKFLRITLFLFAFLIVNALTGLFAIGMDLRDDGTAVLALSAAVGAVFLAQWLIGRYRFYRFGIEEAAAVTSAAFFAVACGLFMNNRFSALQFFLGAAGASFIVFRRFGYLYAGVAAVLFAGVVPYNFSIFGSFQADTARRLLSMVILLVIFGIARERRKDHDREFPGDLHGVLEATAWAALYLMTNLKASTWLSSPDPVPQFYWATYAGIWILPAIGLFLAVRDRHRWMLDANIVMAIGTMMSNKPYLERVQQPWDPIVFGLLMIAIALGLKRWLAGGIDGSRNGFIATRLLASERERLAIAGGVTALGPGAPQPHTHEPPPSFGGGRSGGAGASGKF